MQQLLQRESKQDLEWFFDDWIYRDAGLPEFKVADVNVRPTLSSTFPSGPAVSILPEELQPSRRPDTIPR